jgi:hypothetical protein
MFDGRWKTFKVVVSFNGVLTLKVARRAKLRRSACLPEGRKYI